MSDRQNFENWFGASKIVDDLGAPLVVYHGTDTVFSEFMYGEFGFHFGSLEQAKSRGDIVMELHLRILNPIVFDTDFGSWHEENIGPYLLEKGFVTQDEIDTGDLQGVMMGKGFDGYLYPNGYEAEGMSYAVFSPEQIKSIHHIGDYDKTSANIHGDGEKKKRKFSP